MRQKRATRQAKMNERMAYGQAKTERNWTQLTKRRIK